MKFNAKFEAKKILITGGTRGIGRGIAEHFLHQGANIWLTYHNNAKAAQEFINENESYKDKIELAQCDNANSADIKALFQTIDDKWSGLDILVNNAGLRKDNLGALMPEDDWDQVLDTNLKGAFLCSQQAIKMMMANKWGRIINISSVGARLALPGQANYAASKAGLTALTLSLAKECGKKKITINSVAPGFIDTELLQDLPEEQIKEYKKTVPLKRFGTVQEVAATVAFLASDEAAYITGTTIDVAGGL